MVSMKDIAKKCGVSVATVSKALNGHKDISQETRERICAAAEEMGYKANSVARALKTNRSYNLGMLFLNDRQTGNGNEYLTAVMEGFKAEAEIHGYDITFISSHLEDDPNCYVKHCRYRGLDGIVTACVDYSDPRIQALGSSGIPMVTVDYKFENHTAIMSDNTKGVQTLVRHAWEKGHRKIAFLHGEDNAVTRGRLTGFRQACRDLGLQIPEEYIIPCAYHNPSRCEEAVRQLLRLPDLPTCILFPDDFSFIGGHKAMLEAGFVIPPLDFDKTRSLSAIGYNGIHLAGMMCLTTYTQNAHLIGKTAAQKLIYRIEHPAEARPEEILISGQLLEGESVLDLNAQ